MKLKLKIRTDLGEVLTKEELKQVLGGGYSTGGLGSGSCGGNNKNVYTACDGKGSGDTCTYCLMPGTSLEQIVSGTCHVPSDSVVVTDHRKYCD